MRVTTDKVRSVGRQKSAAGDPELRTSAVNIRFCHCGIDLTIAGPRASSRYRGGVTERRRDDDRHRDHEPAHDPGHAARRPDRRAQRRGGGGPVLPAPLVLAWPDTFGPRTDEGFDEVARQLRKYLAGGRREFDLPLRADGSVPQRRVWDLVAEVPYGQTITYGGLTRRLNCDVTPQQVGVDISRNPLCTLIPCHPMRGTRVGDAVVSRVNGESGHLEPGIRVLVVADDGLERNELGPRSSSRPVGTGKSAG
jgi:O-6-methylguanine DNA methyltransferase